MQIESEVLQARLKNCLLTIIELEPVLIRLTIHSGLVDEFKQIKDMISKVSRLKLSHEEVDRIEGATRMFLKELDFPGSCISLNSDYILQ